ncbi:conserved hypothetical protein [Microcystis aeruginosa PCC 9443]|uniref:Uncharacterized protein n=1 Tax=Microcystis aeruginosa PCC 9443 TaxID=1160281 RepID=I4GBA8_MICAE|nr:conserved hypothetical protein [Microcystis aeruginosa PCC 9443]
MGIQPRELNRQGNNNSHYYSTNDSSLVTQEPDTAKVVSPVLKQGVGRRLPALL